MTDNEHIGMDELLGLVGENTGKKVITCAVTNTDTIPLNPKKPDGKQLYVTAKTANGERKTLYWHEYPHGRQPRPGDLVYAVEADPAVPHQLSTRAKALPSAILSGLSPEIRNGHINIDHVVRRPGVATKIMVSWTEEATDEERYMMIDGEKVEKDPAVQAVGKGAENVKMITRMIREPVEITSTSSTLEGKVKAILAPASVRKVTEHPGGFVIAEVPANHIPAAKGREGVNVKFTSEVLPGKTIIIIPEGGDHEKAISKFFQKRTHTAKENPVNE